jgi:hypothetical protein
MMTYHKCDNDAKLALLEKSKTDAETRKAIALARALSGIVRVPDLPMTIEETEAVRQKTREKIRQDLDKWDPLKDLQKTARKNDKVVTMESVVRAYGSMMEDLRDKIARQPGKEELYREKMTRLQNTFVTYFACIDFDMTATPKLPRVSVPIKTVF